MDEIKEMINECICSLVGDTSVAEQIAAALEYKGDVTEQLQLRKEIEELKMEVARLKQLVGDTSVSEQINQALNG